MNDAFFAEDDEFGLIGACLTGTLDTCADAFAEVKSEWIETNTLRDTYETIRSLSQQNRQISLPELGKEWKKLNGNQPIPFEDWNKAMEVCPSPANLPNYVKGVVEAAHRRQLRLTGDRLIRESAVLTLQPDQIVSNAESGLSIELSRETLSTSKQVAGTFIDQMQERFARKGTLSGITTGFYRLDQMTDGLQLREMAIIAARPSIGKTAIAIAIAEAAAIQARVPTLFISLEMSKEAIFRRSVASIGGVPMQNLKSGDLSEGDMRSMSGASAKIASSPLWFLDGSSSQSIASITANIRRAVRKHGVKRDKFSDSIGIIRDRIVQAVLILIALGRD